MMYPTRTARSVSIFATLVLAFLIGPHKVAAQASTSSDDNAAKWAIAVHGGAGGNPKTWSDKAREARRAGMNEALGIGKKILADGGTSLDAVEAVIRFLEDNAAFNAGRGAVVTTDGIVEMDASIMDGETRQCGAIASVKRVKNPITLARRVMTETKHVLLVAEGANRFAVDQKVPLVAPEYFLSYNAPRKSNLADEEIHYGTVGCVALDTHGHLAAGTSTGGTSKKLPGRVGDSPIVGAGTFADDDSVAVSGTGVGEEYIRNAVAYDVAAQMLYAGRSLQDSVTEIMTQRLRPGIGGLICVSKDGDVVMQHNTPGMSCAAADSAGRFETFLELEDGGRSDQTVATSDEIAIGGLIEKQSKAWNAGDLEGFMSVYWKSDELTFSSGGQTTRGWDATLKRYKKRYPDSASMGQASFSELEISSLGNDIYKVLGRWQLERETDPIGGRFTLIVRRMSGQWKIVHDHTSISSD